MVCLSIITTFITIHGGSDNDLFDTFLGMLEVNLPDRGR